LPPYLSVIIAACFEIAYFLCLQIEIPALLFLTNCIQLLHPSSSQPVLQDSRSRAQIELPDLTASALMQLYKQHAPDKAPAVQAVLEASLQGLS